MAAGMGLFQYGLALAQDRLDNPRDDITTTLMHAEVGTASTGSPPASSVRSSCCSSSPATRRRATRSATACSRSPNTPTSAQLWIDDFDAVSPTAVEEIVRWATPVIHFRRTATRDTEVGGQAIKEGEKVVMFYNSANRDERVFDDPFRFDVTRTPNEHVGFGAGGPHFCLGANLARREIRVMFEELFRRLPDIEITRRARHAAEQLHPRHQAHALRLAHRQRLTGRSRTSAVWARRFVQKG